VFKAEMMNVAVISSVSAGIGKRLNRKQTEIHARSLCMRAGRRYTREIKRLLLKVKSGGDYLCGSKDKCREFVTHANAVHISVAIALSDSLMTRLYESAPISILNWTRLNFPENITFAFVFREMSLFFFFSG
jgi:hypothetical protein